MNKKIILSLLFLTIAMCSKAQTEITNISKPHKWSISLMSYCGVSDIKTKYNRNDSVKFSHQPYYNYGFGLTTHYQYSSKVAFEFGFNHIANSYNKDINTFSPFGRAVNEPTDQYLNTFRIHHLNIPLNLNFSLTNDNRFTYGIGLYYGFYIGSTRKVYYYNKPEFTFIDEVKYKSDFGITNAFKYNIKISKSISLPLVFRHNLGLKNINKHNYENLKTRSFQLGIGLSYIL